jgi:RNA polymerase primary sigma factor
VAVKARCPEEQFLRAVYGGDVSDKLIASLLAGTGGPVLRELDCRIRSALSLLSYRERGVLEMRFGLGDGYAYTLAEAGIVFQLTRERVRQIQGKAIRKLALQAEPLRQFLRRHKH